MAGHGPADLYASANELLNACVEALDSIPIFDPGLVGAPDRTFVSPGQPALDCCDQLSVHVTPAVTEFPGGRSDTAKMGARKNLVAFTATITRCLTSVTDELPPDEALLDADSQQIYADGWALWNHIWNLIRAEDLFTLCGPVSWDGLRPLVPSGGCGGWTLTVRAEVEGYEGV